jgi:antitoxin ParD1/3/4
MASSKAIQVDLGPQRASLQRRLESGQYDDASEVVRDALRALDREDVALDAILRAKVKASMANKRSGAPIDDVFKRVRAKVARKGKAAGRGA